MHRFTNILLSPLGTPADPTATQSVFDLALRNGADVKLLGVVPEPSQMRHVFRGVRSDRAPRQPGRDDVAELLDRWHDETEARTRMVIDAGDPAEAIASQVTEHDHDLVVVASDDYENHRKTIRRILRTCPCPVWVLRPTRSLAPRVLAAVTDEPDHAELDAATLEIAASMSEIYGGELHVAHAWNAYGEDTIRRSIFLEVPDEDVTAEVDDEQAAHRQAVDELVTNGPSSPQPRRVHVVKGFPAEVIPDLVYRHRIDLLVMGTAGRTGLTGIVVGNTAESVLDQVKCSVMAVKAPRFSSPQVSP